ncbi:MAG: hypothetical protein K2Y71_23800 [Xanthobacteraceae bacterium]|nr:hypothetical protein [Xanthobacteraceae bacterium]
MCGRASWFALALAVSAATMPAGPASAASILELNFWLSGPRYDGVLPPCEAALDKIAARFAEKEASYWNSNLKIQGYERVREVAFRPWAPNTIPRRFCSAVALVSDGLKHPVHYSIAETTGMIGAGWGVEWCVVGLDRNMAFSPACRMARP